jgi:hypothetical protein
VAAHLTSHDQTGMDAKTHRQLHALSRLQTRIEYPHSLHNTQAGVHGPPGIVFMRPGIAKVHQQAVAQILGDVPIKALDY